MKKGLSFLLAVILCGSILWYVGADPEKEHGHPEEAQTEEIMSTEESTEELSAERLMTEEGSESLR